MINQEEINDKKRWSSNKNYYDLKIHPGVYSKMNTQDFFKSFPFNSYQREIHKPFLIEFRY